MFKPFDRYILKEIFSPFGLGLLVYTSTLLIDHILRLSSLLISKNVSLLTFFLVILYVLPDLLSFTIPMANLMGILAGLSRLSTDSEIIAFRTMGIPNRRILRPVLSFSLFSFLLSFWLISYAAPEFNFQYWKLTTEISLSYNVNQLKPGIFNQVSFYTLYFRDMDSTKTWKDVMLYSPQQPNGEEMLILSENGRFIRNPDTKEDQIALYNCVVHSTKSKEPEKYSQSQFSEKYITLENRYPLNQQRRSTQLNLGQLSKYIQKEPGDLRAKMEFHNRFALPFSSLALGLLGLSLGISTRKGGKFSGLIISLGIIFLYYIVYTASRNLIMRAIVSPFWGNWLPNLILLALGIIFYRFASREKEINWEKLFNVFTLKRKRTGKEKKPNIPTGIKLLDFYVLRRFAFYLFLVFFSLMLVFYIINIIELMDEVIENHIPFHYVMLYNLYTTPYTIMITLPVSILTALLLVFSLMSKNNEITALQVSGISLYRLVLPTLLVGLILSLSLFAMQETIQPRATIKSEEIRDYIFKVRSLSEVELNKHWVLGKENRIYFYHSYEPQKKRFINFTVLDIDAEHRLSHRITCKYARWVGIHSLSLSRGYSRTFQENEPGPITQFSSMTMDIEEKRSDFFEIIKASTHMNIRQLKQFIRFLKSSNSDSRPYESQLYYNYAYPLSALVLAFIALPFAFLMGKRGSLFGIGLAVSISLSYWGTLSICSALGRAALLSPFLSAFAPAILFSLISLILFLRVKT